MTITRIYAMQATSLSTTIRLALFAIAVLHLSASSADAQVARGLTRALERRAASGAAGRELAALLRRDAARESRAAVRALPKKLTTHRYVGSADQLAEMRSGLRAGSHTTSRAAAGRPPGPLTAQRNLGLPRAPEWRLKIEWPKGWPVRKAKALGGTPGRGEITSPLALPPSAVKGAIRLRQPRPRLP